MEEWLYTHQEGMTPQTVRQAARDIGQVTDFDAKYASTLELVKGDVALGKQLQVASTPTFFINGVKIDGAMRRRSSSIRRSRTSCSTPRRSKIVRCRRWPPTS